jgi:NADH-quinone oxidoreductase subunit L
MGAIGACLTAFYMTRLMCLTFWGQSRVPKSVHPHESPLLMTIPLMVLALLSVVGGWIGIPHVISEILPGEPMNVLEHWLEPVIKSIPNLAHGDPATEWTLMGVSVTFAIISATIAYQMYLKRPHSAEKTAKALGPVYELVSKKYLVDELYFAGIINPLIEASKGIWYYIDVNFIDKCTYWVGDLVKGAGSFVRASQNGNLQQYAMYIGLGIVAALSFILLR